LINEHDGIIYIAEFEKIPVGMIAGVLLKNLRRMMKLAVSPQNQQEFWNSS